MLLTHLSRMAFPTIINWTGPLRVVLWHFTILFKFQLNTLEVNSGDTDQTPRSVASDLVLHCLRMSHKKVCVCVCVCACVRACVRACVCVCVCVVFHFHLNSKLIFFKLTVDLHPKCFLSQKGWHAYVDI